MRHAFKMGGSTHDVELSRSADGYRLHCDGSTIDIDLMTTAEGRSWVSVDGRRVEICLALDGDDLFIHLDGEAYHLRYQHPLDRLAAEGGGAAEDQILAPMPGTIVTLAVGKGDAVERGETLLVMESMKMETTIPAARDAVVADVHFEPGQTFDRDALLMSLEPQEKTS